MGEIRLLIVNSDNSVRRIIREHAVSEGYLTDEATDGICALKLFRRNEYHLVVMDTALPELDGINVCRQIRKVSDIPVIFLSEHSDEEEKLLCFDSGADDFLVKPFSPLVLMARVKVFLHRSANLLNIPSRKIVFAGIHIDTFSRSVYVDEKIVQLTNKDYELLVFLSQNPNKAFSRDSLLDRVWGADFAGSDRTVDTHVKTLRECIKPYDGYIATVWGYGYKFEG